MSQVKRKLSLCIATVLLFLATIALNELLFTRLEFSPGINWIHLPAGVKLPSLPASWSWPGGDLSGTLIVLYTAKAILTLARR